MKRKKKWNTQLFIQESNKLHNYEYDYSLLIYEKMKQKVEIICQTHGIFEQTPEKHLLGQKCSKCVGNIPYSNDEFIKKANNIHNNKYDYSLVEYKKSNIKVKIICKKHGVFNQIPNSHLLGKGCCVCARNIPYSNDEFIEKANSIHNNKYDYSLVEYKKSNIKVEIICKNHGSFFILPNKHLHGTGCQICGGTHKNTLEEFIEKANTIHNNKYDYSNVDYKDNKSKINIICKKHGLFKQSPNNHLCGCGCPMCKNSKGEEKIANWLKENNIKFDSEKIFNDLKHKSYLKFDFFISSYNTCIEYDGIQHYKIIKHFGNRSAFMKRKYRDKLKNKYCKENNINILRISYKDFSNIENILFENLDRYEYKKMII